MPGLLFAILIGVILNVVVAYLIFTFSYAQISYVIAFTPILWGICLGFGLPYISNIFPIQKALSRTIRDAIDVFHQQVNDISIKVVKLESMGISPVQLVLGLTLVSLGLLTYYFIPATFLFDRFDLFFMIINALLVGMLLGLSFICFLLFSYGQKFFIWLFTSCYRKDKKLRPLVYKNLNSHNKRNSKTSMMFTIALAFLIFGGTSFGLIGNMI